MAKVWNSKVHWPEGAVLVDRRTKWGNPFRVGQHGTRAEVIEKYEKFLQWHPDLIKDLHELRGKDLVCHCAPKPCHADVLLRLANEDF